MLEEKNVKQRVVYGRLTITVPMPVKEALLGWSKKSGMNKAQFLRTALMMGGVSLADSLKVKEPSKGYFDEDEN